MVDLDRTDLSTDRPPDPQPDPSPDPPPGDAEIVAIGNELLLGETVDTNSAFIARRLSAIGVRVTRTVHVGDDRERMSVALEEAASRARWVVVTGGLGPTRDDLTREVVADVFDRPLRLDEALLAEVEAKFRRYGYATMPPANRSQAEVPAGARVIGNAHGTAPGLIIEEADTTIFVLPGVPSEMRPLLEEGVLPEIARTLGDGAPVVRSRRIGTAGIGESALAERIDDLVDGCEPVEVAFLPDLGQVNLRLTVAGRVAEEADRLLESLVGKIVERLADSVYGIDDTTLPGACLDALRSRGWTVAVAESCTAGELAAALTSVPGSSDVFLGGIVAYANRVKEALLHVPDRLLTKYGAVSEEVCERMAEGVRERLASDVGCSITGIAGPGGGTIEKPVGLVFCGVATPAGARIRRLDYEGSRESIRRRATVATLALLLAASR